MRTLIIGKVWPEPRSSAAGSRTLSLIEAMRQSGWSVHFATSAKKTDHSLDLGPMGLACTKIAVNDSSFDTWIADLKPDLVIHDRFMTEEQFGWRVSKVCPEALQVLDTSDLHCLRAARREQVVNGGELNLYNEIARREIASIYRSDLSLIISEVEMQILKEQFQVPASQLFYLPLMLDPPSREAPSFEERRHFMMIGNYLHEPNWDAVRWCCQSIWPQIRQALPDAELHLYGAYEPDKARQLDRPELGIYCKGRAKDACETMAQYRVNLAPLRFGAGQKGKVADAFSVGTPTIATPIAAESMQGSIEWGCSITADASAFAATAIEVYSDPALWKQVQTQCYRIAEERLSKEGWMPQLMDRLQTLAVADRAKHFIGQMMRHHQHRSHEYMSRWIEAKNQPLS